MALWIVSVLAASSFPWKFEKPVFWKNVWRNLQPKRKQFKEPKHKKSIQNMLSQSLWSTTLPKTWWVKRDSMECRVYVNHSNVNNFIKTKKGGLSQSTNSRIDFFKNNQASKRGVSADKNLPNSLPLSPLLEKNGKFIPFGHNSLHFLNISPS